MGQVERAASKNSTAPLKNPLAFQLLRVLRSSICGIKLESDFLRSLPRAFFFFIFFYSLLLGFILRPNLENFENLGAGMKSASIFFRLFSNLYVFIYIRVGFILYPSRWEFPLLENFLSRWDKMGIRFSPIFRPSFASKLRVFTRFRFYFRKFASF